jgi:GxxExxY protein
MGNFLRADGGPFFLVQREDTRIIRGEKMIHEELSGKIIGAAMEVLNELKPGLDEKLYERALIIELKHRGHNVSVQSAFPVSYRGELIGNLIPDLIVDDAVIVDPKVVSCFTDTHVAQMIGYLNITRLDLAILINFKNARLEWKRVLHPQEPEEGTNPDLHAEVL